MLSPSALGCGPHPKCSAGYRCVEGTDTAPSHAHHGKKAADSAGRERLKEKLGESGLHCVRGLFTLQGVAASLHQTLHNRPSAGNSSGSVSTMRRFKARI